MTATDVIEGRARWCVIEGEALATLAAMPDCCVGAVVTDPPYSSGGFTRGDRTKDTREKYSQAEVMPQPGFGGDNRDQRSFAYWCALWASEALRVAAAGAPLVQFSDWRQLPATTDAMQAGGWVWRGILVWDKGDSCRPAMGRFRSQCEYAPWATKGSSLDLVEVGCLPGVVLAAPPVGDNRVHLTQKPEAVMETAVRVAPPGCVVLDPFAGSGTTGVAALRTGRRCILIEKDAHYAAVARERLEAESQGLTLRDARAGQLSLLGGAP